MINLVIIMFMVISIVLLLLFINLFISKKAWNDREKSSPFECGFNPFNHARLPISVQFFIVSIMFLTFDIELAILVPMIPSMMLNNIKWLITSMTFLILLIIGLMIEWQESNLTWKK